ncbi:hypothetical protein [Mucilaginibacter celer]|uniref:Uncharacterized protein n=1 Tax=Mucilaginibacter celer TaxID=2305508 RepID=A0A494VRU4_9SPHI|nr:hypothetical protein [Mucilaginibacter celer]AYL96771.1 hypothetical protein HYN43_016330 [Mucilaginibacter celer]
MNPVFRSALIIALSLISLMFSISRCRQNQARRQQQMQAGWTPEVERQMYNLFYEKAAQFTNNDDERKQFSACCMIKLKALLPNGITGTELMTDSVKAAAIKMGLECSKNIHSQLNIWQPEVVQQLKLQFYSYPEVKLLPANVKKEYVDCLAFRVTTDYPTATGADSIDSKKLKRVVEKARNGCLVLIANKFNKLKIKKDTTKAK